MATDLPLTESAKSPVCLSLATSSPFASIFDERKFTVERSCHGDLLPFANRVNSNGGVITAAHEAVAIVKHGQAPHLVCPFGVGREMALHHASFILPLRLGRDFSVVRYELVNFAAKSAHNQFFSVL
jgi:hypothetical protein